MARSLIALYDPSQPSKDGAFWSWHAPELDPKLLNRLYYDVAVQGRPDDPNRLDDGTIVGGIAQLTPEWACVYRFGNGGRDLRRRPGRFVMLAAFLPYADANGMEHHPGADVAHSPQHSWSSPDCLPSASARGSGVSVFL